MGNKTSIMQQTLTEEQQKNIMKLQKQVVMGIILAKKKKLDYKLIDFTQLKTNIQSKIIKSMQKSKLSSGIYNNDIMPIQSIMINIDHENELYFSTYFSNILGFKEFEEKNVLFKPGSILIKGPLSEIYASSNIDKLHKKYKKKDENTYIIIQNIIKVIKITGDLYYYMINTKLFKSLDDGEALEMYTSYGGKHIIKQKDYLVVDNNEFYRIKKEAFKATYTIINKFENLEKRLISTNCESNISPSNSSNLLKIMMEARLSSDPNLSTINSSKNVKLSIDKSPSTGGNNTPKSKRQKSQLSKLYPKYLDMP